MKNKKYNRPDHRVIAVPDAEKKVVLVSHKAGETVKKPEVFSNRGFAAMEPERRKEIAKLGGSVSRRNRIDLKEQRFML